MLVARYGEGSVEVPHHTLKRLAAWDERRLTDDPKSAYAEQEEGVCDLSERLPCTSSTYVNSARKRLAIP